MKKYILPIALSLLSTSALAQGKWNAGVAVGAGMANFKETLNIDVTGLAAGRYKFKFKGAGPVAGLNAGYTFQRGNLLYGINVGGYKDFYTPRNEGVKHDYIPEIGDIDSKNDFKRKYTWELAGIVGRMINAETHFYGKVGAVRSAFREQFSQRGGVYDYKKNVNGWGGVAGLGVKRAYENGINVGIEYSYQWYERMGTTIVYGPGGDTKNQSKLRPQYHNVVLTLSKSF